MNMRIELQAIPVALQGLPAAMEGQRFFVLSDLHMHAPGPLYDGMISAARAAKPHLIFLCGDLIDEHTPDAAILEPVFTALRAIAPVVAINGNNDAQPGLTAALHALYRKCDITLLENEARDYTVDDASIHIIGVQDPEFYTVFPQEGEVKLTEPEMQLRGLLPADSGEEVNIVLVHRPERVKEMAPLGPKLIISGHAHGGQMRLFGRGMYAPGQGVLPKYTSGLYEMKDGGKLVVCRGIGNHAPVPRLNNPPHAVLVLLTRGE